MENLLGSYKRGKFLQGLFGKAVKEYGKSDEALKQSLGVKYRTFLSRRKFQLVCKTQSSVFNAEKEIWMPRNISCQGFQVSLPQMASDDKVDKFVKRLNIGHVCDMTGPLRQRI